MERRTQWNFLMADDGWRWKAVHPNDSVTASAQAFKTLKECTTDATQHGYVVWRTEEERRRTG